MKRIGPRLLPLLTAGAMVLAACGSTAPTTRDQEVLSIVVTTTIWGDVVSNVTGEAADVETLFPVGADSHAYQLSSSSVASMQRADLVIVNGLLLEEGILDAVEALEKDGANILELAPLLDPIPFGAAAHPAGAEDECDPAPGGEEEDPGAMDEHRHDEGDCDPHVWMDPLRVARAAELIAEELARLDPATDWITNAAAYADALRSLDGEVSAMLAAVPEDRRKLITNHEAFGYFADRYGFEVVGVVIPGGSTLADPSSAELADLVGIMVDENIDVIFAETVEPSRLAEAVAGEAGGNVEVVPLFTESLGGPGSGGETYVDVVRTNAERIAGALS